MAKQQLRTIRIFGALGERFGKEFKLCVATPAEAIRALICQLEGFREALKASEYQVIRVSKKTKMLLDESQLALGMGRAYELCIVPVASGAKGGSSGIGKIIAGVVLIVATIFTMGATGVLEGGLAAGMATKAFTAFGTAISFGQIIGLGVMMALSGVATMFTASGKVKQPKYSQRADVDDRPSFIFNGAVNVTTEGATIPVVYGKFITGTVVVSAGIQSEALPA